MGTSHSLRGSFPHGKIEVPSLHHLFSLWFLFPSDFTEISVSSFLFRQTHLLPPKSDLPTSILYVLSLSCFKPLVAPTFSFTFLFGVVCTLSSFLPLHFPFILSSLHSRFGSALTTLLKQSPHVSRANRYFSLQLS